MDAPRKSSAMSVREVTDGFELLPPVVAFVTSNVTAAHYMTPEEAREQALALLARAMRAEAKA